MWAEDWYDKRWTEFVNFNNKADELQRETYWRLSLSLIPQSLILV